MLAKVESRTETEGSMLEDVAFVRTIKHSHGSNSKYIDPFTLAEFLSDEKEGVQVEYRPATLGSSRGTFAFIGGEPNMENIYNILAHFGYGVLTSAGRKTKQIGEQR